MHTPNWFIIPLFPSYEINADLQVRHQKFKKIKKFYLDDRGYLKTNINKNGKKHKAPLHRLVASAFAPNPQHKRHVHHKDENKLNNHWDNLEWLTQDEHIEETIRLKGLQKGGKKYLKKGPNPNKGLGKEIIQMDDLGDVTGRFKSIKETARFLSVDKSNFKKALLGKRGGRVGYYKGFFYKYAQ